MIILPLGKFNWAGDVNYLNVSFSWRQTYFLKHSQNTQILCYAKQCCFPNKLCFMSKPAEQGLDRVSLSGTNEALLWLAVTRSLWAPENSAGPL